MDITVSSPTLNNSPMYLYGPSPKYSPIHYQKLPNNKETYLAFVVAQRNPLNYYLDIYWPEDIEQRYKNALRYDYTFISEELGPEIKMRRAYSCHLKGVEIINDQLLEGYSNMKEAYRLMIRHISSTGGWVLVSVSDIDIYRRVLINMFDIVNRYSLNNALLKKISSFTGKPIARSYVRPSKTKNMFLPSDPTKNYNIIYED